MTSTMPAIRLDGIGAAYRQTPVLHDVSFAVAAGEMIGILGPNGAGKSTLFAVLSGLMPARHGRIEVFGQDVRRMPPALRARTLAVVPQEVTLLVPCTVEEIVMLGRTAVLGRLAGPSGSDRHAVEHAMELADVTQLRRRPLNELSGGERQRAIVAMALAQEPRILLMDEATSHLDLNHRLDILERIRTLNRETGLTVLMISHDLQLAAEFSRRLILLDQGRLVADGNPEAVLTQANLRQVYRCEVRVFREPGGSLCLLPPQPGR
jgi:iron complex transport system ATP-binding protein